MANRVSRVCVGLLLAGCDDADVPHAGQGALTLDAVGVPGLATGVELTVRADPPAAVTVVCAVAGDRWVTSREAADTHVVRWYGLLPGLTYACTATADGKVAQLRYGTPRISSDLPAPFVSGTTSGLTLLNHVGVAKLSRLVVLDAKGRVRWHHNLAGDPNLGVEAAFLPETTGGPVFLAGGGEGYNPRLIGLDGVEVWTAPSAVAGGDHHHDVQWVGDEEILALSHASDREGVVGWDGFALETVRAWTGERTWSWRSQTAVNRDQLPAFAGDDHDVYHANAMTAHPDDPEGASYMVSLKHLHQIARLDIATGDLTWKLGVGGDFALLEADGSPATDERWFFGQHAPEPHLRPDGRWDFWIHDNGMDRPDGDLYSRVLRLEVDVQARTARIAWEWTEPGWYEPVFGDVDVLPDGHVLVTMGHCPQCPGSSDLRRTAIVELDPETDAVTWRATLWSEEEASYRAQRIEGCDLFPENTTLCPDGAQRLP